MSSVTYLWLYLHLPLSLVSWFLPAEGPKFALPPTSLDTSFAHGKGTGYGGVTLGGWGVD